MRKTSHDGLDSTSITSGIEHEIKKSSQCLMKSKKGSIKRKVPNFSHEPDDGTIEPLLQTDKEKTDNANRSAKYLLSKTKTDSISEVDDLNIVSENVAILSAPTPISTTNKVLSLNNLKDSPTDISNFYGAVPFQNHTTTNVSRGGEASIVLPSTKNSILDELTGNKSVALNSCPLIFTTAKIHTDSKTKLMEHVHITPVPILSTIEGSDKSGITSNSKHHDLIGNISYEKTGKCDSQITKKHFPKVSEESACIETLTNLKGFQSSSQNFPTDFTSSTIKIKGSKQPESNSLIPRESSSINTIKQTQHFNKEQYSAKEFKTDNICSSSIDTLYYSGSVTEKRVPSNITEVQPSKQIGKIYNTFAENKDIEKKIFQEVSDKSISQEYSAGETFDKQMSKNNSKKLQRQKKTTLDEVSTTLSTYNNKNSNNLPKDTNVTTPITTTVSVSTLPTTSISSNVTSTYYKTQGAINNKSLTSSVTSPLTSFKTADQSDIRPSQTSVTKTKTPLSHTHVLPTKTSSLMETHKDTKLPTVSSDKGGTTSLQTEPQNFIANKPPNTTETTTLPSYIVPTSKTKIGTSHFPSTSGVVSKPNITTTVTTTSTITRVAITTTPIQISKTPPSITLMSEIKPSTSSSKENKAKMETHKDSRA